MAGFRKDLHKKPKPGQNKKPLNRHQLHVQEMQKKKKQLLQRVRYHDVDKLKERVKKESPAPGDYMYDYKLEKAEEERSKLQPDEFRRKYKINFEDLPISNNTIVGLQKRKFIKMTEIQRCSIPHTLAGRDVLAASKTGSGKTLAYLIPLVERLYQEKWNPLDGLGAIVILPTRELATQVFEVFNSFTANHDLSVGLVIGGKNLKYEKDNMKAMNVLICTPGRLLQHMNETPDFDCSNLKLLVLDEADLILELGFAETLNAILYNLPQNKQTILFSATLSKNIHELSKLSLKNPEFIFLHEVRTADQQQQSLSIKDIYEAPVKLTQYYMEVKADEKLNMLFSFLRSHKKNKVLVFLSTCKQVRFVYESFRKLRLGPPVFELQGRQKQSKRMAIFFTFAEKKFGVLFTTNLAARGLDFPSVEWIVQVDCPDDDVTYLHRIGRTARHKSEGNAMLMLLPSEMKMLERLKERRLALIKLKANPEHQLSITNTLQSYLVESVDLKYLAQRAFISYLRSVFFAKDKEIFDATKIDADGLAESYGLIQTPVINFKGLKGAEESSDDEDGSDQEEESEEVEKEEDEVVKKKQDKLEKLKEKIRKLKEEKARKRRGESGIEEPKEEEEQEIETEKPEKSSIKAEKKVSDKQKKSKKEVETAKNEESEEEEEEQQQSNEIEKKKQISNVKHEKLMKRKNQDVLSENFKKLRAERDDDDIDDFLVKKQKNIEEEDSHEDLSKFTTLKVSKNQLKKIKDGGYFDGKNITYFTEEGKPMTSEQVRLEKYKDNEKKYENDTEDLPRKFALKLITNKEADVENERLRRKEKRDKKKMKEYEKTAVIHQRNDMMLGDQEDEEDDDENQQEEEEQEIEQEEQVESEEEKPKHKKSKKNKHSK